MNDWLTDFGLSDTMQMTILLLLFVISMSYSFFKKQRGNDGKQ